MEAVLMLKEHKKLLDALSSELVSIQQGVYRRAPRQPWRAGLVFEDSPCCPNYGDREHSVPCEKCVLMQFVPEDRRREEFPCRFIPLNEVGETVDSLYRCGTRSELEIAVTKWLRETIHQIETEPAEKQLPLGNAASRALSR
jgi:hypothetical protein